MTTVLDELCVRVRACAKASEGIAAPIAILWIDSSRQWHPAIDVLKAALPELIELGDYSPEIRRGPAIWVRCIVDRALPLVGVPDSTPPILYLPGISRQDLRAGEECRAELRPLVELLYRGNVWLLQGSHEITVRAFLKSPTILNLDVAEDAATNKALLNAVKEILVEPIASLKDQRLEAKDFNELIQPDPIRDLLRWIASPVSVKQAMPKEVWSAFVQILKTDYTFDPDADGELTGAQRICKGAGAWGKVWSRFEEAPTNYPGITEVFARVDSKSEGLFSEDTKRYLSANDNAEVDLEAALTDLQDLPHKEACLAVLELERQHGPRRDTVWARLGRTRFANVLKPLAVLARGVGKSIGGVLPNDFKAGYEENGWQTDLALLDATALIDSANDEFISELICHLAKPWLDDGARAFQKAISANPIDLSITELIRATPACCILFVDGLRYDLARVLAEKLDVMGCKSEIQSRWAAFPTVTATAKPAVSPVANQIEGKELKENFAPCFKGSNKVVNAEGLRNAITAAGGQIIASGDLFIPKSQAVGGWHECGEIDSLGHKLNARLAREVRSEVAKIAETVQSLLSAGWESVRVVTDHGWLLLPNGLPKAELSKHLAQTKWSRCALLQGEPPAGIQLVHWHWNANHTVATPPGIACFSLKQEYAHGGISIQECLIPDLLVTRKSGAAGASNARIESVSWAQYRCVIKTRNSNSGTRIDIRLQTVNGNSVGKGPRPIDSDESVSIPVTDDYENKQLVVVLLDAAGTTIAQHKTKIGDK